LNTNNALLLEKHQDTINFTKIFENKDEK